MGLYQFQVYLFSSPTLTHLLLTLVFFSTFPSLASFSPLLSLYPKSFSSHFFWLIPLCPSAPFCPPPRPWFSTDMPLYPLFSPPLPPPPRTVLVTLWLLVWACGPAWQSFACVACLTFIQIQRKGSVHPIRVSWALLLTGTPSVCVQGIWEGLRGIVSNISLAEREPLLLLIITYVVIYELHFFFIPLKYSKLKYDKHLYQGLIRHFLVYSPIIKALEGNYCSIH